jgi:predicted transcriptional regulator
MDKTTLYLSDELRVQLAQAARREKRPQAEIVREALGLYFSSRPGAKFRSIGLGADAEVTGENSEAWLKQAWSKKARAHP